MMSWVAVAISSGALQQNALSPEESRAGWRLLFDGQTTEGWRGYKKKQVPPEWTVTEGVLWQDKAKDDLITVEKFASFDLKLEWRIAKKGNSGIMYRVAEEKGPTYETGPEYQLLDDEGHGFKKTGLQSTGADYAIYPPVKDATKPIGEWNSTRILVDGNRVEHWLNGEKIVEYEFGSEDWTKRVAASKFKDKEHYGRIDKGHIALQAHGGKIEFRSIRIRVLPDKSSK